MNAQTNDATNDEPDQTDEQQGGIDITEAELPGDFRRVDTLTIKRERPDGRSYPRFWQVVEAQGETTPEFLTPFYVIEGKYAHGQDIVAEADTRAEAKAELIKVAHEESYE